VRVLDKTGVFLESHQFESRDVPASITDIHSLLGLVGYYRKFIEGFSKITKPMNELLGRIRSSIQRPHTKLVLGIEEATNHFPSVSDA
jgi:hypothetical protein